MTENVVWHPGAVDRSERAAVTGGPGMTVWMTGLSGSGKSTIAALVEEELINAGRAAYSLDGDNVRHGLNGDLGFSADDRTENVRRNGEVARLMADAGLVVLVPVISPYQRDRDTVRAAHERAGIPFVEVYIATPIDVCEARDPKGLYAQGPCRRPPQLHRYRRSVRGTGRSRSAGRCGIPVAGSCRNGDHRTDQRLSISTRRP